MSAALTKIPIGASDADAINVFNSWVTNRKDGNRVGCVILEGADIEEVSEPLMSFDNNITQGP